MWGMLSSSRRRQGDHLQLGHQIGPGQVGELGVLGVEGQGDEALEAAGEVLLLAQTHQVVHPVLAAPRCGRTAWCSSISARARGPCPPLRASGRRSSSSRRSGRALSGWKISAPPPGQLSRPASRRTAMVSGTDSLASLARKSISTMVKAFRCTVGKASFRALRMST